jgi:flagellar protein FliJ
MSEFRSIHLAIELATRQRDMLAKNHAQVLRNMDFAKSQMVQLESYALDTDAKWIGSATANLSGEMVRHHYQFVARLQQAIGMQSGVMKDIQTQIDAAHKALLQAEFRLSGLNQVLKKRQSAQQLKLKRREQHATDEFAALRHIHGKTSSPTGEHHEY